MTIIWSLVIVLAENARRFALMLLGLCTLVVAGPIYAYEVSPMRIFLQPSRGQNSTTIAVNNIRADSLPIEIVVLKRVIAPDGSQTFEPADDQFVVFPPQAEIAPSQSQAIRIQYIGTIADVSEAFVVQVREVPVNRLEGSGIQFTYNFGVAVYIQPERPRSRLAIQNPEILDGKLRFRVTNSGNDYGFINGQVLEYQIGDRKVSIDRDTLTTLAENPIIPPNASREFAFPIDGVTESGPTQVKLLRADS